MKHLETFLSSSVCVYEIQSIKFNFRLEVILVSIRKGYYYSLFTVLSNPKDHWFLLILNIAEG